MEKFNKLIRIFFCLILTAALIIIPIAEAFAEEEEPTGFPAAEEEMIDNTTDSSNLPDYVDPGEVYGVIDNENAEVTDSMISDEARDLFSSELDRITDYEPIEDKAVSQVLGNVENFLSGGGLQAYSKGGNLLLGSSIGLAANKKDKVKVLGTDTNASSWVFVVDKDAMSWLVKDTDGEGIPGALVTISYLDESGNRVTKSTVATDGNTPGIAVFDDIPESFFGLVDIQAEGYHAASILDKSMGCGQHYTIVLDEAKENELYIRGVDLSGKDMVNEETKLALVNMDTADLDLKVIVSKNGNASFPDSVKIYSENRGSEVLQISQTSDYPYDTNTRIYTASGRWAEQDSGLLKDGDIISIKAGDASFDLEHVTVENAVTNPGSGETDVPVTTKSMNGNISDRLSGGGFLNQTAQVLQVPVTFGAFPDGTMVLMASYDITKLDPNTQYKFSSLFQKSWNPKNAANISEPLEVFEKSFWENTEKVKKGQKILESPNKIKCVTNASYDFSMSFSLYLKSCYNKETKDSYGSGGILFSGGLTAGLTEYFLITAGPVVIPVYIGFEGHLNINTTLSVNFCMDRAPTGHDTDAKWKYTTDDGVDVNARIEVIIGFSVFGGVGVKGVLGVGATGYVDFDIAAVLGKGKASILSPDPHSFIDVLYGVKITYDLLFYTGTVNLDCASGAKRLCDSNGETDKLAEMALEELEFKNVSLADCAENFTPQLTGAAEQDDYYVLNDSGELLGSSNIVNVDASTYADTQIQFAATKDYTALFRLGSNGERVDIYYQLQNRSTGNLHAGLYKVRLPEGENRSVSEFVVVPNKTDWDDPDNCNKVYIGAVLVDDKLEDENERMRSSDVAAIVVDLDQTYTTSSVIASDPDMQGEYLYSAPKPAGREDYCSVVYAATKLQDDNGNDVNGLKEVLGATQVNTSYYISWGKDGDPAKRNVSYLSRNEVYSSGAIAPNEPSYWTVDPIRSSDKYLVVKGYGANGYTEESLRCMFRVDIEGMVDKQAIVDGYGQEFDGIITNWQYLNGCNYFVAGDSIYWMNKVAAGSDPADYEWEVEKVNNGSGVLAVDNRYAMITNNNQSAIYLIGVVDDYDVNVEESTAEKGYNIAKIYTLTTDKSYITGETTCTLHGPLDMKFAKGDKISCFAAAYNPDECAASGLTIAYSTPIEDESRYACQIRMWKQNADKGLLVSDIRIPDYRVISGQPAIELHLKVRNYGYGRENPVPYDIYDENGVRLMQVINGQDVGQTHYTGIDLYTGDYRTDVIYVRPNPDWKVNEEHEIFAEVGGSYKYNGNIEDVVESVKMSADNTTLTAKNTLIGGKHYISTTITNNTLVGEKTPQIKIVPDYGEGEGRELKFHLPTNEMIYRFDPEDDSLEGQIYNFDIDFDSIWEDGLDEGLLGVYVSLVDEEGDQQSNEVIYLQNPAEKDRPEPEEVTYSIIDGADPVWDKGSSESRSITVKRSADDENCFSHYTKTLVDGNEAAVTAKAGSTVVTFDSKTLGSYSTGSHTVTIMFDDGQVETTLLIKEAEKQGESSSGDNSKSTDSTKKSASDKENSSGTSGSDQLGTKKPRTGDENNAAPWIMLMIAGAAAAGIMIYRLKKSRS